MAVQQFGDLCRLFETDLFVVLPGSKQNKIPPENLAKSLAIH